MSKRPDILVEIEKIKDPYCGLGQLCDYLSSSFTKQYGDGVSFYGLPKEGMPGKTGLPVSKLHRAIPFFLPKSKLWHATHQDSEYIPTGRCKKVLSILDLNYIHENRDTPSQCEKYLKKLQKKIDKVDAVTFISHAVMEEVKNTLDVTNKVLKVVYCGTCIHFELKGEQPKYVESDDKFLFTIGTVVPKKNFHVLVELMKGLPEYKLIIAGPIFHKYAYDLIDAIKQENLEKRIILSGKINESEKLWLYKNCEAFMFPSLLEGFGLPVIEAMSLGKPVFLSNIDVLHEVAGSDAFYFETYDTTSMTEIFRAGMKKFSDDSALKNRLIERSEIFSWDKAAKEFYQLYQELLNE